MPDDWPIPVDAEDLFRRNEKRMSMQERRPSPMEASDLLGPGFSARGVQILDWNSEEATFNGYFYSTPGAQNSPDPAVRWIGHVLAQDDNNGVQQVWEAEPPVAEKPEPEEDEEAEVPTEEDPEPEPPTQGAKTPIRHMQRFFSISPEGRPTFTSWVPAGSTGGGRIGDLADVKIFEPLLDHSVLLWDQDYNDGEGAWVNHAFIPGIAGLHNRVDDLLAEMEEVIDIQDSTIRVYRQDEEPVPGIDGVEGVIPDGSVWFDTDDGLRMYVWNGSALQWESADVNIDGGVQQQIDALGVQVNEALYAATAALDIGGAPIETTADAERGIKMNSNGIVAFNASGDPVFVVSAATGALTLAGPVLTSASITGGTVTGAVFQTQADANRGIKFTSNGLAAYTSTGVNTFFLNAATGGLYTSGPVIAGGDISGATVTGGTVQSTTDPQRGIKFNSNGLLAYDNGGVATFAITSDGSVAMRGTLTSGSLVSGAQIIGGTVSTSQYYVSSAWLDSDGFKAYDSSGNSVLHVRTDASSSRDVLSVRGGAVFDNSPYGNSRVLFGTFTNVTVNGQFTINAGLEMVIRRDIYLNSSMLIEHNLRVKGSFMNPSSRRYKSDIRPLPISTQAILDLEPKTFRAESDGTTRVGFIAEEAHDLGLTPWIGYDESGEPDSFNYLHWVVALQAAAREQRDRIEALEARVATLENRS